MGTKAIDEFNISEVKQSACVHSNDTGAHIPIWIGTNKIMWLCPVCADGVSDELIAVMYCAKCAEAVRQEN